MIGELFRLDGKVAIVTGAGKGIGAEIARVLAEAGADVVVAARTQEDIDATVASIEQVGRKGLAVPCDVTKSEDLEVLVARTLQHFGRIDILVNNAGGTWPVPSLELSERAFEKILRFNLTAPFLLSKLVVPHMVEIADEGVIVNISSGASILRIPGMVAYGAAKAGLNHMTRTLAKEWAPKIRLNAIVVGQVLTEGAQITMGEELLAETASNIPLKRLGNVRDIAACALYLASPASSWVTADVIEVNGGTEAPPVEFPVPSL
jgi:7-alpha-hydroxysteroid dehydrogenase